MDIIKNQNMHHHTVWYVLKDFSKKNIQWKRPTIFSKNKVKIVHTLIFGLKVKSTGIFCDWGPSLRTSALWIHWTTEDEPKTELQFYRFSNSRDVASYRHRGCNIVKNFGYKNCAHSLPKLGWLQDVLFLPSFFIYQLITTKKKLSKNTFQQTKAKPLERNIWKMVKYFDRNKKYSGLIKFLTTFYSNDPEAF